MHANACVLLRARALGCADLPTTGLDWVLRLYMDIILMFLEVAIALLSLVYDFQAVACFGTQAMRVRPHFVCLGCVAARCRAAPAACAPALSLLDGQGQRTAAPYGFVLCSTASCFCGAAALQWPKISSSCELQHS